LTGGYVVIAGTCKANMPWRPRSRMGSWKPEAARNDVRNERCKNFPRAYGST